MCVPVIGGLGSGATGMLRSARLVAGLVATGRCVATDTALGLGRG
ncbi:hypothetical protein [Streptomyces afghaniensis]